MDNGLCGRSSEVLFHDDGRKEELDGLSMWLEGERVSGEKEGGGASPP